MDTPKIIWEDEYLIVLNKPSGWVVDALQDWVKNNFSFPISNSFPLRNGLVHRLDKETSGIILFAKNEDIFYKLQKQFADRKIQKVYLALVHGEVKSSEGEINAPVGRLPWKRTKFGVFPGGRPAQTFYKKIAIYNIQNTTYSLMELHPKTGRTHQLRVHLKHIGHPIVSDPLYAGRKQNRKDRLIWPHLFLHASEIKFIHPITGKLLHFKAPLPEDLKLL